MTTTTAAPGSLCGVEAAAAPLLLGTGTPFFAWAAPWRAARGTTKNSSLKMLLWVSKLRGVQLSLVVRPARVGRK